MAKYVQPLFIVDSSAAFWRNVTFDSSVYLKGTVHISGLPAVTSATPVALVLEASGNNAVIKSKLLGTMAGETSTNYYGKTAVDSFVTTINASISTINASISRIDNSLNDVIEATTLFPTITDVSAQFNILRAKDASLDASIGLMLPKAGGTMTGLLTLAAQGFTLEGQNITNIDTSADGLGVGLDTHLPTSAAVKSAIDAAIAAGVTADNGLIENPTGNIQLGGLLTRNTSINFNGYTMYFSNIGTGTNLNAIIQENDALRTQQLGTMALGASVNYYTKASIDSSFATVWTKLGNVDTSLNGIWTKLGSVDTSLLNLGIKDAAIDVSLNAIWVKFGSVDTSLLNLGIKNANQDVSINGIWTKLGQVDGSLKYLYDYETIQDASIAALASATVKSWNGLTTTNGSVGLGGSLDISTIITASATNTLSLAGLVTSTLPNSYAVVQDSAGGALKTRQLGSMAWEASTNYVGISYFNASLGTVWTKLGNVDTSLLNLGIKDAAIDVSLNAIWTKFGSVDTSLLNLGIKDAAIDVSLNAIWTKFGSVDTSLLNLGIKNANQDISINDIWTKLGYVDTSISTLNLWNVNQDLSIASISAAQGNYVLKTGDTMTGPLTINSTGGLVVNGDVSIMGGHDLYVSRHTHIGGNLTVDGSLLITNIATLNVSSGYILLNTGLVGAPPPTLQSGIVVERGSSNPYVFVYDENLQTFRIGISQLETSTHYSDASTQAVATREDTPVSYGVPFWNGSKYWFETSIGFTFVPNVGLSIPKVSASSETTALMWNSGTGLVTSRALGTMAFNSSTYVLQSYFDSSLNTVWTKFGNVDTSLNNIWTKFGSVDTSLLNLGIKDAAQDVSISALDVLTQAHSWSISDLSTNKISAVASTTNITGHEVYSGEANNISYIKRIVAGSGASISSDASTITISVTGATSLVAKYVGTFDGTAASPFTILQSTHGLPASGPYTISVYESGSEVYTGISINGSGDVALSWAPGSLADASCKFIITG